MAPFYGWGSTASRLEPLRGGSLLFTTKFPKFLVLILPTSEGWKAELTLKPPGGFEHGTPGLGIQQHYAKLYKTINRINYRTDRMIDLLNVINYETKIKQRSIIWTALFHSKQVFPAPKQTKWVNIKDAQ